MGRCQLRFPEVVLKDGSGNPTNFLVFNVNDLGDGSGDVVRFLSGPHRSRREGGFFEVSIKSSSLACRASGKGQF